MTKSATAKAPGLKPAGSPSKSASNTPSLKVLKAQQKRSDSISARPVGRRDK
jgi:hypothetical protein